MEFEHEAHTDNYLDSECGRHDAGNKQSSVTLQDMTDGIDCDQ